MNDKLDKTMLRVWFLTFWIYNLVLILFVLAIMVSQIQNFKNSVLAFLIMVVVFSLGGFLNAYFYKSRGGKVNLYRTHVFITAILIACFLVWLLLNTF